VIAKRDHFCQEVIGLITLKMAQLHASNQNTEGACRGYVVLSGGTAGVQVIADQETLAMEGNGQASTLACAQPGRQASRKSHLIWDQGNDGQICPGFRGKQSAVYACLVFLADRWRCAHIRGPETGRKIASANQRQIGEHGVV